VSVLKKLFLNIWLMALVAIVALTNAFYSPAQAFTLANANRTGENLPGVGVLRNEPSQRVHLDFQLNTNSCASCHMTHTATGGKQLFRNSRSAACIACHDGTMGFLNVQAPPDSNFGGSIAAGTFGVAGSVYGPSMHNIDLFPLAGRRASLFDAPGGRRDGTGERGAWTPELGCVSCHAAHGSHSIRLLHYNPNHIAVRPRVNSVVYGVYGGLYHISTTTNFTVGAGVFDAANQVWRYSLHGDVPTAPWVFGYTHAHLSGEERIPQHWTRIYAPALFDPHTVTGGVYADPTVDAGANWAPRLLTRFFTINYATGAVIQTPAQRTDFVDFVNSLGVNEAGALALALRIDVAQALQVRALASSFHQSNLDAGVRTLDFIAPTSYEAPAYNLFCSACHTDYLPAITAAEQRQRGVGVGIYSVRYRHSINVSASVYGTVYMPVSGWTGFSGTNLTGSPSGTGNRLMCLSCHFAHGTDSRLMLFADGTRVSSGTGGVGTPTDPGQVDRNPSSALKRFINAASCITCHFTH